MAGQGRRDTVRCPRMRTFRVLLCPTSLSSRAFVCVYLGTWQRLRLLARRSGCAARGLSEMASRRPSRIVNRPCDAINPPPKKRKRKIRHDEAISSFRLLAAHNVVRPSRSTFLSARHKKERKRKRELTCRLLLIGLIVGRDAVGGARR